MKIGIVSDIHGDIESLQTALKILKDNHVDRIVCAGDLVDGDIYGDDVVELIRAQEIACVQGNHDRDAFPEQSLLRRKLKQSGETKHDYLLESKTIAFLSMLPLTYEFDADGIQICVAHGTPESNTSYLFPESSPEKFQAAIKQTDADILILGHTHVPMFIEIDGKHILNVGSVYRNRLDDSQTCGILNSDDLTMGLFDLNSQ